MFRADANEIEKLGSKLIRRLVLPIALLSCVNAIDRMNVSFAAQAISNDIGLTPTTFGFGVSAFFDWRIAVAIVEGSPDFLDQSDERCIRDDAPAPKARPFLRLVLRLGAGGRAREGQPGEVVARR